MIRGIFRRSDARSHWRHGWHAWLGLAWALAATSAWAAPDLNGGTWRAVNPPDEVRTVDGKAPPLRPEGKALYEQRRTAAKQNQRDFDVTQQCKPAGLPRQFYLSGAFEFLQRDEQIVILYEWNRLIRIVDMNVPQRELIGPAFLGQSVGRWEGDTLVVDTIGFKDNTVLDNLGLPHSDQLQLTERFAVSKDGKTIKARFVINDPVYYTATWQTALTFKRDAKGRIREDICPERQQLKWGTLK